MVSKVETAKQRLLVDPAVKFMFRVAGIRVGSRVSVRGVPIVSTAPNSSITIGDRVALISSSRWTALGVRQPTILRTLRSGARIAIGDDTGMSGAVVCAVHRVVIGQRVLLGANVTIADTDFHPLNPAGRHRAAIPEGSAEDAVEIGDDVFVGTGAIILKGVTIGAGAVIGAGSVVTRPVPPGAIVAGNPAKPLGYVEG